MALCVPSLVLRDEAVVENGAKPFAVSRYVIQKNVSCSN